MRVLITFLIGLYLCLGQGIIVFASGIDVYIDAQCASATTIDVQLYVGGGSPAYSYAWTGPSGFTATSEDLTNVPQGAYQVTITDMSGCTATTSIERSGCTDRIANFCNATVNNPRCEGDNNGSISMAPSGGTSPYIYTWSHLGGQGSNLVLGLSPGEYTVTVEDSDGAQAVCTYNLFPPTELTIDDVSVSRTECLEATGMIAIQATPSITGSTDGLMYSIDGGSNFQSSNIFTELDAGDYLVVVRDQFGCQAGSGATVLYNDLNLDGSTMGGCNSTDDVYFEVTAINGVPPYTYEWSSQTDNNYTNTNSRIESAPVGIYVVTVTDSKGCTASTNITLTNCCSVESICNAEITNPSCGEQNGSVEILPLSNNDPYSYTWEHDDLLSSNLAENLQSNILYKVTVSDGVGCTQQCLFLLESQGTFTVSDVQVTGAVQNNGSITVFTNNTVNGCDLEYSIDGGNNFQASNIFQNLTAGDYQVIIRDCSGCETEIDVNVPTAQCPSIQVDEVSCNNDGSGNIQISLFNNMDVYMLSWVGPNGFMSMDEDLLNIAPGTYQLTLTNALGCEITETVTLEDCAVPFDCSAELMQPLCIGSSDGAIELQIANPADYTYSWSQDASLNSPYAYNLPAGSYSVTVMTGSGSTSQTCSFTLVDPFELVVYDTNVTDPDCNATYGSIEVVPGLIGNIGMAMPVTGQGFLYSINNGVSFQSSPIFNNVVAGVYQVVVANEYGCLSEPVSVSLEKIDNCNALIEGYVWDDTNGNGVQDGFEKGIEGVRVNLYNSDGDIVKYTYSMEQGIYLFEDVLPGDYYVEFITDDEWSSTLPNAGGNDNRDSDVDNSNGFNSTQIFTVQSNQNEYSIDGGFVKCATLGSLVWFDSNRNDKYDAVENGINGVKVDLYKQVDGEYILYDYVYSGNKPNTPSDDGYWEFCVPPGSYYVSFNVPSYGLVLVRPGVGFESEDSDVTKQFGDYTTGVINLSSGEVRTNIGAGFYEQARIGNRIWLDSNANGLQDSGESGLQGVEVQAIHSATQEVVATDVSDDDGYYQIDGLEKQTYFVKVVLPTGYAPTIMNGQDESLNSDISHGNGINTSDDISVLPGEFNQNVDVGVVQSIVLALEGVQLSVTATDDANQLAWNFESIDNYDMFNIERAINDNQFEIISTSGLVANTLSYEFSDTDIAADGTYYYRISVLDTDGQYAYSSIRSVTRSVKSSVEVYPNPVNDKLYVSFDNDSHKQIKLIDTKGVTVLSRESNARKVTMDVNSLSVGVYTLQVTQGSDVLNQKILIVE